MCRLFLKHDGNSAATQHTIRLMNLLAFDTSTEYLSLALLHQGTLYTHDELAGQSHSQLILPQIQRMLHEAGLNLTDLDGLAFGAGPGSFTGVRIAAGVAQGLAFGANLPVLPVCTLLALAQASSADQVIACLDARMGEIYHAAYIRQPDGWKTAVEPGLYKPEQAPALSGEGWTGAGSGWQTYAEPLERVYSSQLSSIMPALLPTAQAIVQLALPTLQNGGGLAASEAMPIYIRNRVALKTTEREEGMRL